MFRRLSGTACSATDAFWYLMDLFVSKSRELSKHCYVAWISILILPFMPSDCVPPVTECILDTSLLLLPGRSTEGNWGGFLNQNCTGEAFHGYLYALGQRANLTGSIFLNMEEQRNCLLFMRRSETDVLSCGIEKLTVGGGRCSDFIFTDVMHHLGGNLRSLKQNCDAVNDEPHLFDRHCDICKRSWKDIKASGLDISRSELPMKVEDDICRFAVLVSLTGSMMENRDWIQSVYTCLQGQPIPSDEEEQHIRKEKGVWSYVPGLIWLLVVLLAFLIMLVLLSRRWRHPKSATSKVALEIRLEEIPENLKLRLKELRSATDDFHETNLIGEGTAGKVYKGTLQNGRLVAIKHIINEGHAVTFFREITSLSHIRHPNLVDLVGFCTEGDQLYLVYEMCVNGNLSEWLFSQENVLPWTQRLTIAADVAKGLSFLHTQKDGSIIHRDIKPTNILLTEDFSAKLSDFGLSKIIEQGQSFASSEVRGTFGYVDPEYQKNHVNSSADVYSFGVVLLQILSGEKVINMKLNHPKRLDEMAKDHARIGNHKGFADPKLDGEYSAEAFDLMLQLALSCTGCKDDRPTMDEVVKQIQNAIQISVCAKASTPRDTP